LIYDKLKKILLRLPKKQSVVFVFWGLQLRKSITQSQGPVAAFCEQGNEPSGSIKKAGYCLTSWATNSLLKNILHHWVLPNQELPTQNTCIS